MDNTESLGTMLSYTVFKLKQEINQHYFLRNIQNWSLINLKAVSLCFNICFNVYRKFVNKSTLNLVVMLSRIRVK